MATASVQRTEASEWFAAYRCHWCAAVPVIAEEDVGKRCAVLTVTVPHFAYCPRFRPFKGTKGTAR